MRIGERRGEKTNIEILVNGNLEVPFIAFQILNGASLTANGSAE